MATEGTARRDGRGAAEDFVKAAGCGPWPGLAEAFGALQQAGLPRSERRYLPAKVVEQMVERDSQQGGMGVLQRHEEVLARASVAAGCRLTPARLQAELRRRGARQLAQRVEKLGRARHSEAHPDLQLPGLVEAAMAAM